MTGYILAAAGQITVTLISAGLITLAPNLGFRSALPLLVTVLIALTFGAGPSFFAAFWGAALVYFALLPPRYDLAARTPNDLAGILLLLAVGVAISILASQVTRSQRTAERAHAEALEARAEAAGRAEQLQTAFDAMADAVLLYDANKCLVRRNNALDRMLRFEQAPDFATLPDERRYAPLAVQDTEGNVVPLERMPQMCALAGEVFTGERAVDLRMVAFDGRTLDVNVSAAPVRDANGRITGSVTVYRDVTERRQLERRTQETLAALLEMAQALVTATPEDGPATATISASQPRARISSSQPIPPARQAARRLAELTQSVLGCKRVVITLVNPESDTIRPLAAVGLTPEQEAHMWATWPERATLGATLSPQDLARLRAGEALTSDLDADGLDRQRNPYSAHSALVAPGLLRGKLVCLLNVDYASDPHTYSAQEQSLASAVTQLVALVIERERLAQERTQAQSREMALRTAQEQMDRFLSLASHELRTPLTTMKASIQMSARRVNQLLAQRDAPLTVMREGLQTTIRRLGHWNTPHEAASEPWLKAPVTEIEALERLLQRADEAVTRQDRLVSDLLDVSRIRSNTLEHHFARLDLVKLAGDAIEEQRLVFPNRTVTLEPVAGPISVWADGDRVRQALANYLINALRYSPVERPVTITLTQALDVGVARVAVRDEGPGIAADEIDRVWERFYRAPGVAHTSGSGIGLGLGLFISREIIERHGGQVGVESEEGQGAEFWFTLPLADVSR
ncbi:MAG TPA: ATP-binding protein [Ktedonobacterales bacterium]